MPGYKLPYTVLCPPVSGPSTARARNLTAGQVSERAAEQRAASLRAKSVTEAAAQEKAAECQTRKRLRSDHPKVTVSTGASRATALRVTACAETRQGAIDELQTDMFAASALRPRDSCLRTWEAFHGSWFEGRVPCFPLTCEKLFAVSSLFKRGRYSSFPNYLGRAREQHVLFGHAWTQQLDRVARACKRSVLRGIMEKSRSDPFDEAKALEVAMEGGYDWTSVGRPVHQGAMLLTGLFFMLREIELSAALFHEARVTESGKKLELHLPASKTDGGGRGVSRFVECYCGLGVLSHCPVHLMAEYLTSIHKQFIHDGGVAADELPLFPDSSGRPLTKSAITQVVRGWVRSYGGELRRPSGSFSVSAHAFRISGARFYAKLGLDPVTIGIHGRWKSEAILTYLADAPVSAMTSRIRSLRAQEHQSEGRDRVKALEARLDSLEQRLSPGSGAVCGQQEMPGETVFVINRGTGVWHKATLSNAGHAIKTWCCWACLDKPNASVSVCPPKDWKIGKLCSRCFPSELQSESASESSESDSTSTSTESARGKEKGCECIASSSCVQMAESPVM